MEFDPLRFFLCPLGVKDLRRSGVFVRLVDFFIVVFVFGDILNDDDDTVSPNTGDFGAFGAFFYGLGVL